MGKMLTTKLTQGLHSAAKDAGSCRTRVILAVITLPIQSLTDFHEKELCCSGLSIRERLCPE